MADPRLIDMRDRRYGRLTVLYRSAAPGKARWHCVCDCGGRTVALGEGLRSGNTRSCGCLRRDVAGRHLVTHGLSKRPEYSVWHAMKRRCYEPGYKAFHHYGGRGITVCDRWRDDFAAFFSDVGPRPTERHELDRINNDGHYEPGNVRWATKTQNNSNQRDNHLLTLHGETKTISEWRRFTGLSFTAIYGRLKRGLPIEQVLSRDRAKRVRRSA
jgi:hypothetical protein